MWALSLEEQVLKNAVALSELASDGDSGVRGS